MKNLIGRILWFFVGNQVKEFVRYRLLFHDFDDRLAELEDEVRTLQHDMNSVDYLEIEQRLDKLESPIEPAPPEPEHLLDTEPFEPYAAYRYSPE